MELVVIKSSFLRFKPASIVSTILIVSAIAYFLYNCANLWIFTIDDSFITFRYSSNWVKGIGPVFNPGLPRAEGYTSFLWMLIMTIPHLFNQGVVTFSKVVGIAATIGTMGIIYALVVASSIVEKSLARIAGGLAVLFYAILPETTVHAVSGMETALFGFTLIGMVYLAYAGIHGNRRALGWLPVAGLINGLIRPEANLLAAIVLLFTFFSIIERRFLLRSILVLYFLPGAIYFVWRWIYYGALLPLPFYIKTGGGSLPGWTYVSSFLIFIFSNFILFIGISLLMRSRLIPLILLVGVADLSFFLFVSPVMGYDYRFIYSLVPLLLVLTGLGISFILAKAVEISNSPKSNWMSAVWFSALILAMFVAGNVPRTDELFSHKLDYGIGLIHNHISIGNVLAQISHTDQEPVLAVTDAGAIPYFSGWYTIDAGGLNNPEAVLGQKSMTTSIFDHYPEVMILTSNNIEEFQTDSVEIANYYQTAIAYGMEVIARTPFYQGDSIWILAKPGGEAALLLANWATNGSP